MTYACGTEIDDLTRIRRERVLPRPGDILVSPGDRVEASQVVARADLPGDFCIVPVARRLDVPASAIEAYLQVELGDRVHRGTVIAKRGRILGRSIESPLDGVVTIRGGGRLVIEAQPAPFELHAYVPGTVLKTWDHRHVVIETVGALIQGAWGTKGEGIGVLKVVSGKPDSALPAESVGPACHGAILIGGMVRDQDVLERGEDAQIRGIITGGIAPELVPQTEELPFPIIVTDGIGDVPMAGPIFELLRTNDGLEVSMAIPDQARRRIARPEVIIPKPGENPPEDSDEEDGELKIGTPVRIVRVPNAGVVGRIVALPRRARPIETGARVRCAEVDVGRDEPFAVPLVNLNILR